MRPKPGELADIDVYELLGPIAPLRPRVLARAARVVRRTAGDRPVDELLDILGIPQETP